MDPEENVAAPAQPAAQNQPDVQGNSAAPEPAAPSAPTDEAIAAAETLSSLGSFISPETRAELEAKINGKPAPAAAAPAKPAATVAADPNKPTGDKPAEEKPAPEKPAEEPAFKSKFGFKVKPEAQQKPGDAIVIETPDHVIDVVNTKFGFSVKDVKELPKFFETAQGWRASAEKLKTKEAELEAINKDLASLPPEFFDAFEAIAKGEDYRKVFLQPKIDFNKPLEKQNMQELVNQYFPGKFTEDDFKDTEKSDLLSIAEESAKKQFLNEKQQHDAKRAGVVTQAAERQKAFDASVTGSVQHLKQSFPGVEEEVSNEITSILKGGPNAVLGMFFDEKGVLKTEAAELIMLAKHGKEEIQNMMQFAAKRTETQINEDLLTRGADTPKPVQKNLNNPDQGLTEADLKKLEELKRLKQQSQDRTF